MMEKDVDNPIIEFLKSQISESSSFVMEEIQKALLKEPSNTKDDDLKDHELKERIEILLGESYVNILEGFACYEINDKSGRAGKILEALTKEKSNEIRNIQDKQVPSKNIEYLFRVAEKTLKQEKYLEAKAMYSLLSILTAACLPVYLALGTIESQLHNFEAGQLYHVIATKIFPKQFEAFLHAGISHAMGGKIEEAKQFLDIAHNLAEKGDFPEEQVNKVKEVKNLFLQDEVKLAAEKIATDACRDLTPTKFETMEQARERLLLKTEETISQKLEDLKNGRDHFLKPEHPSEIQHIVTKFRNNEDLEIKGDEVPIRQGLDISKEEYFELYQLAMKTDDDQNLGKTKEMLTFLLHLDASYQLPWLDFALTKLMMEEPDEAKEILDHAWEMNPEFPLASLYTAEYFDHTNDLEQAREWLKKTILLAQKNEEAFHPILDAAEKYLEALDQEK